MSWTGVSVLTDKYAITTPLYKKTYREGVSKK